MTLGESAQAILYFHFTSTRDPRIFSEWREKKYLRHILGLVWLNFLGCSEYKAFSPFLFQIMPWKCRIFTREQYYIRLPALPPHPPNKKNQKRKCEFWKVNKNFNFLFPNMQKYGTWVKKNSFVRLSGFCLITLKSFFEVSTIFLIDRECICRGKGMVEIPYCLRWIYKCQGPGVIIIFTVPVQPPLGLS